MYWQREVLRNSVSMTFGQTYEYDLPKHGVLGGLALIVNSNMVSAAFATAIKWRLVDYISKIEVIKNGSTVIKSYDGSQALASAFYDNRVVPFGLWRNYLAAPHRQVIPVNFGRYTWDKQHKLDLDRFDQVTLKVTNDATSSEFSTDIKLTLVAYWLREDTEPNLGYFREEEWREWNVVASEPAYNELPTEDQIRRILLRARPGVDTADAANNSSMGNLMNNIKFTMRTGQVIAYEGSLDTLGRISLEELGYKPETMGNVARTAGYSVDVGIGYVTGVVAVPHSMGTTPATYPISIWQGDVNDSAQDVIAYQADYPLHFVASGYGFMYNVPLFCSVDQEDGDVLDSNLEKTVSVDITPTTSVTVSGTGHVAKNAIVLSRLVRS